MEFQTASVITGFGAAWLGVALLAFIYWLFQKKKLKQEKKKPKEPTPNYASNIKHRQKKEKMDRTKLNSLQPANRTRVPNTGWTTEEIELDGGVKQHQWKPIDPPLKGDFEYKFYGSQLSVGTKVVFAGLPKKLHMLEIHNEKVYLDGEPKTIHPSELNSLKKTIRDAEA